MSDKVELKLDWCSYEAAKFAVEHWHYNANPPTFQQGDSVTVRNCQPPKILSAKITNTIVIMAFVKVGWYFMSGS